MPFILCKSHMHTKFLFSNILLACQMEYLLLNVSIFLKFFTAPFFVYSVALYGIAFSTLCSLVLSWLWTALWNPHFTARVPPGLSEHMGTEFEGPDKCSNCQRNWTPHGSMLACHCVEVYRLWPVCDPPDSWMALKGLPGLSWLPKLGWHERDNMLLSDVYCAEHANRRCACMHRVNIKQ